MTESKTKIKNIANNGKVTYITHFISDDLASKLFNDLKDNVPWEFGVYKMYGKEIETPRKLYAMRDKDVDITKSYKVTGSMVWSNRMKRIKNKVEKLLNTKIEYAQLNYYRNGDDYIGWHTDSEVQKGDFIASLSLGAERKFVLRHIDYAKPNGNKTKHEYKLENGSLLIMNDNAAKYKWKHTLPKMKNVGERINVTFRPR